MRPNYLVIAAAGAALAGCTTTPRDDSDAMARALVGEWVYERNDDGCASTTLEEYRADGRYTSTVESCDIVSDGFGIFDYGWYIANEHLCFVEIEEQYKDTVKRPKYYREKYLDAVKRGYTDDHCFWRVGKITARTITMIPRDPERKPFTMRRESWD